MTPESVIEQWAQYFNNGDLEGIMRLYQSDSTLLPTFRPVLMKSKDQINGLRRILSEGNLRSRI